MATASQNSTYPMSPKYWGTEGSQQVLGLLANSVCYLYIHFKLRINTHLKRMLKLATMSVMTTQALNIASLCYINVSKVVNVTTCSLVVLPKMVKVLVCSYFSLTVAIIRYYLATKTARVEAINHTAIRLFSNIVWLLLLTYVSVFLIVLLGSDSTTISGLVSRCASVDMPVNHLISPMMGTIPLTVVTGILYDLAMARFLKERNKIQPVKMVVWSTTNNLADQPQSPRVSKKDVDGSKLTIPVKATIIGALFLFLWTFLMVSLTVTSSSKELSTAYWTIITIYLTFFDLYMPMIVTMTIKSHHAKSFIIKENESALPPVGLQFHE